MQFGRAQSGQPWVQLGGLWATRDGHAVLLRRAAKGTSLALLRTGAPGGTVTLDDIAVAAMNSLRATV